MAAGSSFVRFSFCEKSKCLNLINHPLVAEWGQIFVEKMHFAFCKSFHLYFPAVGRHAIALLYQLHFITAVTLFQSGPDKHTKSFFH